MNGHEWNSRLYIFFLLRESEQCAMSRGLQSNRTGPRQLLQIPFSYIGQTAVFPVCCPHCRQLSSLKHSIVPLPSAILELCTTLMSSWCSLFQPESQGSSWFCSYPQSPAFLLTVPQPQGAAFSSYVIPQAFGPAPLGHTIVLPGSFMAPWICWSKNYPFF